MDSPYIFLERNLNILARPLVYLYPLAIYLICAMQHLDDHLEGCCSRHLRSHGESVWHYIYI